MATTNKENKTELQLLYQELEQAKKEIEKLERIKPLATIASSVVHDIRNSLGIISSTAQFVLDRLNPSEKERESWKLVDRNVESIKNILKGYLGLTRQVDNTKQLTSLNEIVNWICNFIDSQCRTQNIKVIKNLDSSLPLILVNNLSIESSVLNISINAVEAMVKGGQLIFKTMKNQEKSQALLEIEDSGPGISPEILQKLFTPFFTTKEKGTGMGLYSAKACAEENSGKLTCESEVGRGTKMIFSFPMSPRTN